MKAQVWGMKSSGMEAIKERGNGPVYWLVG